VDIRDAAALTRAFAGSDIVYHLASLPAGAAKRRVLFDINVRGTENVLSAALSCGIRRIVHVSSAEVYGSLPATPCPEDVPIMPNSVYGRSKKMAEDRCLEFMKAKGLEIVILRPGSVVGPGVHVRPLLFLFERIGKNRPVFILGSGRNRIQLLSVHDLLDALVTALDVPCPKGPINLAAEDAIPLIDLGKGLRRHAEAESPMIPLPAAPLKFIFAPLQALGLWPSLMPYISRSDEDFILDIARARDILGFAPRYSSLEALIEAFEWHRGRRLQVGSGPQEVRTVDGEPTKAMDDGNGQDGPHDQTDQGTLTGERKTQKGRMP
jgi:nucleoside-diphosphate-sugar epimerase